MRIAFLGLGNMGSGMASRLLAAGHPLVVWNRTTAKAEPLVRTGAELAKAPEAAVAECEIVVTSLMDDASMRNMFDVSGAVFAALRPAFDAPASRLLRTAPTRSASVIPVVIAPSPNSPASASVLGPLAATYSGIRSSRLIKRRSRCR